MSADEVLYFGAYLQGAVREERIPLLLRTLFVTAVRMVEPVVSRMGPADALPKDRVRFARICPPDAADFGAYAAEGSGIEELRAGRPHVAARLARIQKAFPHGP